MSALVWVVTVLLWVLLALLGLLVLVLVLPLRASARGRVGERGVDGRVRIAWGGGALSFSAARGERPTLRLFGLPVKQLGGAREERAARERKPRKRRAGVRRGVEKVRRLGQERGALTDVARRLLRALHLGGRVAGRVGLGDPADTAFLALLLRALRGGPRLRLEVTPDYVEEVVDIEGAVSARVLPMEFVIVALGCLLRREVRRALRALA